MDIATFTFTISLPVDTQTDPDIPLVFQEFNSKSYANIYFPTYYPAHLGEGITCAIKQNVEAEAVTTRCRVDRDWNLRVWGPETFVADTTEAFLIEVYGVSVANGASAESFYVSLYDDHKSAEPNAGGSVTDDVTGTYRSTGDQISITDITFNN